MRIWTLTEPVLNLLVTQLKIEGYSPNWCFRQSTQILDWDYFWLVYKNPCCKQTGNNECFVRKQRRGEIVGRRTLEKNQFADLRWKQSFSVQRFCKTFTLEIPTFTISINSDQNWRNQKWANYENFWISRCVAKNFSREWCLCTWSSAHLGVYNRRIFYIEFFSNWPRM